ncbi:MAG: ABC transporter ATP-binding protein [Planctomycetota bacterium]|jgi:iron complex transport system ATP-binding protein
MSSIVKAENLDYWYTAERTILKDLSFEVNPGTFLAIAGPNGAGKTTLLNLLCGTLTPRSGAITIDSAAIESHSTKGLSKKVAVVRQEFVPVFDFSVIETVMMARTRYHGPSGFESKRDREIVQEAMEATDTAQFAARIMRSLSSGERQRVFIARALAQDTPIVLLDEPTSFLDLKHQVGIYDLLKSVQLEKGKTVLAVTHDINLAAQYCDETLLLGADNSYHIGKTKDVFRQEQIEMVFGVKAFTGQIGKEKFFLPLGRLARDSYTICGNNSPEKEK